MAASLQSGAPQDSAPTLDALAYIDYQYGDPALKTEVDRIVDAEMKTFKALDYLSRYSIPDVQLNSEFLRNELDRVSKGVSVKPFDAKRYALTAPTGASQADPKSWTKAIHHAETLLEYQSTRIANLELLNKYGANSWRIHVQQLQARGQLLSTQLARTKADADEINRKRKLEQIEAKDKLDFQENTWWEYVQRNTDLTAATSALENDVKRLKSEAVQRGLLPAEKAVNGVDASSVSANGASAMEQ